MIPKSLLVLLLLPAAALAQPAYRMDSFMGALKTYEGPSGGPLALLNRPTKAFTLPNGDLIVLDSLHRKIRRLATDGTLKTIAGSITGYSGDGGPATAAEFCFADDGAADVDGNIVFLDRNYCVVRRIDAKTGIISTIAGTGKCALGSAAGAAKSTALLPANIALSPAGQLAIADTYNHRILTLDNGALKVFAGNGRAEPTTDGARAELSSISFPTALAYDRAGNLFYIEYGTRRIRRIDAQTTLVTTVAGDPGNKSTPTGGDGGPPNLAYMPDPAGLTVDPAGRFVYFSDRVLNRIRVVDLQNQSVNAFAGSPTQNTRPDGFPGFFGDGGVATAALFAGPTGLSLTPSGNLLIADTLNHRIREVATTQRSIRTVIGRAHVAFSSKLSDFEFASPEHIALVNDPVTGENLMLADTNNYLLSALPLRDPRPQIYAGNTAPSGFSATQWYTYFTGEGTTRSTLESPRASAYDPVAKRAYLLDGNSLRSIDLTTRIIRTLASGARDYSDIAYNPATKQLVVTDPVNHQLLSLDPSLPRSSFVPLAGQAKKPGLSGDGGPPLNAQFSSPTTLAIDPAGTIYIGDFDNFRIRKISGGVITSYAGGRIAAGLNQQDNLPVASVNFFQPFLALTPENDLVVATGNASMVFQIGAKDGIVRRIAGSLDRHRSDGDGGLATGASLTYAGPVQVDSRGVIYVLDLLTYAIRRLTPVTLGALQWQTTALTGTPGAELPLAVRVRDPQGAALAGAEVVFELVDGEATIVKAVAITGADGVGSTTVRLGTKAGPVRVSARVTGAASVTATLTVQAPAAAAKLEAAGDRQFAPANTALPNPLTVRALDATGKAIPGLAIAWQVTAGVATLSEPSTVTAADGSASVKVTTGAALGPVTITATGGPVSAQFTLMVVAPAPEILPDSLMGAGLSDTPVRTASPLGLMSLRAARLLPLGATAREAGPDDLVDGKLPTSFLGVCVDVNGIRAPIVALEADAVRFQVPPLGDATQARVVLVRDCGQPFELRSPALTAEAAAQAPEFFVAGRSDDGRPLAVAGTVMPESPVSLVATGLGLTNPSLAPGESSATELPLAAPVIVTLAGQEVKAEAVSLPGAPGRFVVRFTLPAGLPNLVEVAVGVGGVLSPTAYLAIGN